MKHVTKLKNISQNIAQIHNIGMKLIICIHSMCDNSENARWIWIDIETQFSMTMKAKPLI